MKRTVYLLLVSVLLPCIQGVAQTSGIYISREELAALPMSGAAWDNVKAQAGQSCGSVDLSNQDQNNNVCILAKALVFARTGQASYRTDTIAALQSIVNMGTYNGRALALGRELGTYAIAADLIDLKNYNPSFDQQFRAKIKSLLTAYTSGGPGNIIQCHEERPNNWGQHCGGTRAAVDAYLGDLQDLARVAQVFKGWLGDRGSYAGFTYGDLSWQCNPNLPVGINPTGCTKQGHLIDGVLPDDQRRSGSFTWPPPQENYVYEALQGALLQAVILHRFGYDAFAWEDRALLRAFTWLNGTDNFPASGDDSWQPWLVNNFYGSKIPAKSPTTPGKNIGWTDWTHAGSAISPPPPPPPQDTTPPVISYINASLVTSSSATMMWTTNEASDTQVDYGTSTAYGSSSPLATTMVTSHSVALSGLTAGTTYHCRVRSKDAAGNQAVSADYVFTTIAAPPPPPPQDTTPPVISNIAASLLTSTGATMLWVTNEPADTQVDYGTSTAYGTSSTMATNLVTNHSVALAGLTAGTTYHCRVRSKDAAGNQAVSADYVFTTIAAPVASGCSTSAASWHNWAIASQSGTFTAQFDATPNAVNIDAVTGLSATSATGYASLAAIVRFYTNGRIEARNGGTYTANTTIPYVAGATYHFRFVVRVASHTYDVYVTPPGSAEIALAVNYAFRTESAGVKSLANWATYAAIGSHKVCNFTIY